MSDIKSISPEAISEMRASLSELEQAEANLRAVFHDYHFGGKFDDDRVAAWQRLRLAGTQARVTLNQFTKEA